MLDKNKPGANIRVIHDIVKEHLKDMEPGDLVVSEGRENGFGEIRRKGDGLVDGGNHWLGEGENKEAIGDVHPHEA